MVPFPEQGRARVHFDEIDLVVIINHEVKAKQFERPWNVLRLHLLHRDPKQLRSGFLDLRIHVPLKVELAQKDVLELLETSTCCNPRTLRTLRLSSERHRS